jgi:NADH-quinone oxidoreductase subunit E
VNEHRKYDVKRQHFAGEEGRLIPLLQEAQEQDGCITRERMQEIHEASGIPLAQIYGVATFYAQFRMTPVGKNVVRICHGTACHVSGANDITDAVEGHLCACSGETTADGLFTIETVSCLGCCSLAPVVMVNDSTYGNLTEKAVKKVLTTHQRAEAETAEVPG